jgi:hypothetical protein
MRESTFNLPSNPAHTSENFGEPHRGPPVYRRVEEVGALTRACADGRRRTATEHGLSEAVAWLYSPTSATILPLLAAAPSAS